MIRNRGNANEDNIDLISPSCLEKRDKWMT